MAFRGIVLLGGVPVSLRESCVTVSNGEESSEELETGAVKTFPNLSACQIVHV